MSYLLWHGEGASLASPRRLFSADEVHALDDVHQLCAHLAEEHASLSRRAAADLEQARTAGWALGLSEGRAAGLAEAARTAAHALAATAQAGDDARHAARAEIAMLALQIARKLIGQLPPAEQLARLAQEAARQALPDGGALALRLHPDHEDEVRALLTAPSGAASPVSWSVHGDASLPREACRLSGPRGDADAALDVQMARLANGWGLTWPTPHASKES